MSRLRMDLPFWIILTSLTIICEATKCEFCHKDFKVLGRHQWRCQSRGATASDPPPSPTEQHGYSAQEPHVNQSTLNINQPDLSNDHQRAVRADNTTVWLACHCGRLCKGRRGLRAHQRSCRALACLLGNNNSVGSDRIAFELSGEDHQPDGIPISESNLDLGSEFTADRNSICENSVRSVNRPGLKLPSTLDDWNMAQAYFVANSPLPAIINDVNSAAETFQCSVYEYFHNHHGCVNKSSRTEVNRERRKIRKQLKQLKESNSDVNAIRYMSSSLRSVMPSKMEQNDVKKIKSNSRDYKKNPWKFITKREKDLVLPSFDNQSCLTFLKKLLSARFPGRLFSKPIWMPDLPPPSAHFSHDGACPTYADVTQVIRKMKTNSSPCPYDGLSIIIFKRCPILRTHLTKLIEACWLQRSFPQTLCRGVVKLIHKTGSTADPANFRPITLQPVMGKIIGACIRNKLWKYLDSNNLIDKHIQKGFWPGSNGVVEHVELMKYILTKQKRYNRDIYVVLLDLKNAFGELHHSLLRFTLDYHSIPQATSDLILSQYQNFNVSVIDPRIGLNTEPIKVKRGVLQGDTLSPLLFNMVFNTLMTTLTRPEMKQCGVLWGNGATRSHWTQFADDAAIISESPGEAQQMIYLFQRWTSWADLIIRPDKCHAYAASKINGQYRQILPHLYVDGREIPAVAIGGSVTYLGHQFSFSSENDLAKTELIDRCKNLLQTADGLPVTPLLKLHATSLLIRSQLDFTLRQYAVGSTWIKAHVDTLVTERARQWLRLPPCATMHHLSVQANKGGHDLLLPSQLYELAQLRTRQVLGRSSDPLMRDLFQETRQPAIDWFINLNHTKAENVVAMTNHHLDNQFDSFLQLSDQNLTVKSVLNHLPSSEMSAWSNHVTLITPSVGNFARKALIRCLPTNANLTKWNKTLTDSCPHCGQRETDKHVMNNCQLAADEGRYTWRHDCVLRDLVRLLSPEMTSSQTLYCDLTGFRNPNEVIDQLRPDIVAHSAGKYYALELTCPHELNLDTSRLYKEAKYSDVKTIDKVPVTVFTIEVSSLGFVRSDGLKKFCKALNITNPTMPAVRRLGEMSLRCSYFIFCSRHRVWPHDPGPPVF